MASAGEEKLFLQALIQMAAGAVHLSRGRPDPAARLLALALAKLDRYPDRYAGVDVTSLRALLAGAPALVSSDPDGLLSALRAFAG